MPIPRAEAPLIVTAHLDAASFAILDGLRRRHFPAKLNRIPAHVSLFHKLPGEELAAVAATLESLCGGGESFDLEPTGLRSLGGGVAIEYAAPELSRLRASLAQAWLAWLSAQDRQGFKAHVTIQNKVPPETARKLLAALREDCEPPVCRVEGVELWRYLDGPWERIETFRFADVA